MDLFFDNLNLMLVNTPPTGFFGQIFGQGFEAGTNHTYSVQYYPAKVDTLKTSKRFD